PLRRGRNVRLPLLVCDGAPEAEPAGHGLVVDRPDGRVGVGPVGADMAGRGRVLDAVGGDAPPDRVTVPDLPIRIAACSKVRRAMSAAARAIRHRRTGSIPVYWRMTSARRRRARSWR